MAYYHEDQVKKDLARIMEKSWWNSLRSRFPRIPRWFTKTVLVSALAASCITIPYLAKENRRLSNENIQLTQENEAYVQRFAEQKPALEILLQLEKGFANFEQSFGSKTIFEKARIAAGGIQKIIEEKPIYGEDGGRILEEIRQASHGQSFSVSGVLKDYDRRVHNIGIYEEKIPGFGAMIVGDLENMVTGQDYSEDTVYLMYLGTDDHFAYDTSSLDTGNPKSLEVKAKFDAEILRDYMHPTKGRSIFLQATELKDALGRPLGWEGSHFDKYSGKFPKYKYGTDIEEGELVGYLGYTGFLSGLHLHQEFYVGTEIDPKTGEVKKWELFDPYENKTYGQNIVYFTIDNIPVNVKEVVRRAVK